MPFNLGLLLFLKPRLATSIFYFFENNFPYKIAWLRAFHLFPVCTLKLLNTSQNLSAPCSGLFFSSVFLVFFFFFSPEAIILSLFIFQNTFIFPKKSSHHCISEKE